MRSVDSEVRQLSWSSQLRGTLYVVPRRARGNRFELRSSSRNYSVWRQKVFITHLTATNTKVYNYLVTIDTQLFHTVISVDQLSYNSFVLLICH